MASRQLVFTAVLFLALGIASSVDIDDFVADPLSQDDTEDSVEYPRPGHLTARLDEEDDTKKTVEDIPGLTEDMVFIALSEAKREVRDEERNVKRDKHMRTHGHTLQSIHYRSRFKPELEPGRKRALIMERTTNKLADSLG